jgi:hypothetical protein
MYLMKQKVNAILKEKTTVHKDTVATTYGNILLYFNPLLVLKSLIS